jgi:hypothetical protein
MKDLAEIFAAKITLSGDVQLVFDARRRTDAAHTVRGRFSLLLDDGTPVVIGEVVYAVAFLTQAHEYICRTYFGADAEKLLNRFAEAHADSQNLSFPVPGLWSAASGVLRCHRQLHEHRTAAPDIAGTCAA